MARTKNSGSDVLSIKSAKHKSVSSNANNANNVKSVKSAKKNAKAAKRSSSSTATSASGHRLGVAAVALASTLSMVLPGAAASARTSFNPDSFDPSYVNSVAKTSGKGAGNGAGKGSGNGKGDGDGNGLYKHGLLNTGATFDRTTRQMVGSAKEYSVKNTDPNSIAEGVENQETVAGDSSVGVKDSGEYLVTNGDSSSPSNRSFDTNNFEDRSATSSADNSATKTATKSEQDTASSEIAKPVKSAKKSDATQTKDEKTNPAETGKVAGKTKSNVSVPAHKTTEKSAAAKPKVENSVKPADTKASDTKPAATNPDAVKPAGVKPAETPAAKKSTQPETSQPASAKPVAKTEPEAKAEPNQNSAQTEHAENQQPANAKPAASNTDSEGTKPTDVKPAENQQPANAQSGNAESSKPVAEQNTNAQPSSTHSENTNTVSDANTPNGRVRRSVGSGDGASNGGSVAPADNTTATPNAAPASNTTAPSAPVTSTGTESNAGAGSTASTSTDTTAQGNTQGQGSQGSTQGSQANTQGAQGQSVGNAQGADTVEDKSATLSAPGSTPSEPRSASTPSNDPTPSPASTPTTNTGTPTTGTTTNNAATDPNSQVIKPNTDNPEAKTQEQANAQVQTDKKPRATYNLKVRYTIGGAANKQLVQPYELTIDVEKLNKLDKDGKYEYIELPKSAGYRPSVYHSGDYQYYVKKGEGDNSKFVIDDGTDADAIRYLRLSKKLITDYAVKERPAVGGNNVAQAPQTSQSTNPQSSSSTQPKAEDGIQYYGELNINYAPKTAKYYVRHLVQDLDHKDEFHDAPNLGIGKVITVRHKDGSTERIHVTEITGTVGSDVTAVSTYIPGYEPEHNLISSPLSDSEDESDKLVLNLRYYRKAYEVTYDSVGGTDITAQKVYYQQPVPKVATPTRRGYTFKGWSLVDPSQKSDSLYAEDTTIASLDDYKMPDHDVQFRANWEANKTTSYRVNVWVQKADLVDKEHPNSLANYDFVGLVERKNVQTDSEVALDKMNDAGVAKDSNALNGASETDYVKTPELGLTEIELQGTKANKYKDGLIAKFNWMNDTPVTSLEGYDTTNPGDTKNKGKDLFTRYFHVNKELTKELNNAEHDFVPGRPDLGKRSKSQLCADDLSNTLNLVYDRKEYELIFAKPAGLEFINSDAANNAAIKKKDEHGKTTIYCYAGGGKCSEKYDGKDDDNGTEINHKGYRVNVRYGQKLTDIWPGVEEIDLSNDISDEDKAFLGWRIGYAGDVKYLDTPPYRFTKEEFADPSLRAMGKNQAPKISDDPEHNPQTTHELKDNQRLLTADTTGANKDIPYTVIIKKQSIASAKNGDTGDDIKYVLSTDSYSKDDVNNTGYTFTAPSIAGFSSVSKPECDTKDRDDFNDDSEALYEASSEYKKDSEEWDKLTDDDEITEAQAKGLLNFRKKYHIKFRDYLGPAPSDSDEDPDAAYGPDAPSDNYEKNAWLEMKYKRQSYAVQFYNADGNAIKDDSGAAKEKLPFEYSLTKRGNAKLTGEDADLYYDGGNVKSYDASVTKDGGTDIATQFDGKYTFTLNGKTYSIERPDNLPKDYVFKGWAVDQAGTQFINGENKDITMPVNGIKLYAAWGKPEGIKHTVTLNYNMPETDANGNEIQGSNVVKKKEFDHYYVIKENKDIKVPTRKGYDFYGWEIKKNGTTLPYAFGNKVVEDITLDAVWVKDTRYNGTFKHIFLKPGYTFTDYKKAGLTAAEKAAMVDHVSTQTVSGLREHLRYNAEAVYSDETHFPDKHFTSFEASSDETDNTGEFIYQTYNTRKYKVRYVTIEDGKEKDLLPESEVSSVNRKYDVAFYKPIEGFMPETTQQNIEYATDEDGKQIGEKTYTFRYKDVRVLKRKCYPPKGTEHPQYRPDHYTRYVFKVAKDQSSMGSVVDWQGSKVADGSALVYDAIKGTKAYQMPLPTVKAKPGFEFAGWTSQIGSYAHGSAKLDYATGLTRLPIRSEEQNSPEVIYIANFKLKAPVAAAPQVLTPLENISTGSSDDAKKLITNAKEYPTGATFSFAQGEKFDSTPGLHKIKVQVHLYNNTAEAEVLYRVLPDLVYESDWNKFKATEYGKEHISDYVPIKFTGKNDEGKLIGHDSDNTDTPAGATTTLTAYVYKGKDVRIRVPQAFGNDYSNQHYHYVFKGWATKVVEPTAEQPKPEQKFDINSSDRYENVNLDNGVTYHAIYKRIDYFSSSSDNGTVPEDSVIAIFKPAAGRKWTTDGTSGPKVFYVKKGTNLADIKVKVKDSDGKVTEEKALDFLQNSLTNPTGKWSRSSMRNDGSDVKAIEPVTSWIVNEPFQEFVAGQKDWTEPDVQTDYLVAVQGKRDTLPELDKYLTNLAALKEEAEAKGEIKDVKIEYDLPEGKKPEDFENKMLAKPSLYTVPLRITVNYKDGVEPKKYKRVARLKVIYQLMYDKSLPKKPDIHTEPGSQQPGGGSQSGTTTETTLTGVAAERDLVLNKDKYVKVNFINANPVEGSLDENATKLYYVLKKVNGEPDSGVDGVKAPQAVGKDYDAYGYHYVFKGWMKLNDFVNNATNNANRRAKRSLADQPTIPFTTLMVSEPTSVTSITVQGSDYGKLLTNDEIRKEKYSENTTYQAVYEKVMNIIDAKSNEKVPDNYVPYVFLPAFGRKWDDGSYKPKVIYFKSDSTKYDDDVTGKTNELKNRLKNFSKWEVYDAGNKPVPSTDTNKNRQIRVYVANQIADMPVNVSQFVRSVGDEVPAPDELVSGVDPNNLEIAGMHGAGVVYSSGANSVRIVKPGITTVRVKVETSDPNKKGAKIVRYENVPIQVLPNVIAERDLPSGGSQAGKFILENYTKVTYVAGNGGTMQSPMHTYWVRKDRMSEIKNYIPDVLANKGYIFKNWDEVSYSKHIDAIYNGADDHKSTDIERETLAKIAERYGMSFTANIIRKSKNSTFAAIKNILAEAINNENMSYEESRNRLAIVAETLGKSYTAKIIRNSQHSTIEALKNLLVQAGITDADIAMVFPERETIITANFEKMAPMKFKFSGSAREGILTNFSLQNMTEGDVNNTTVTVDGKTLTINKLVAQGLTYVNGINATCDGTACTISGTPKIVEGKPKVELTFTTTDKYGREAEITVEIDVISESKPAPMPVPTPAPVPTPVPPAPAPAPSKPEEEQRQEEYPMPESYPYIPMPEAPSSEVVPEQAAEPKQKTEPEAVKDSAKQPSEALPQTGSDVTQSALIASLLASVGLAGFAAKHRRRKNEDNES
ncbi:InlB B-repeat-containing protein [Gardnerella vaginalis]|uniref:InlB B-repeat-containing protein n=1 Tax=Gardnerella vaginalis TaxID=2702 RepID=UPI0002E7BD3F|nr:InlB B-repeat-containing protein [Gardnerella vaginalis]